MLIVVNKVQLLSVICSGSKKIVVRLQNSNSYKYDRNSTCLPCKRNNNGKNLGCAHYEIGIVVVIWMILSFGQVF